jgi:type I restriction enzyme M protein
MVGVVLPHGVLFRGSAEGDIRRGFIQEDLVEAVVGLPTNLFYGTGIPAVVLILNRRKVQARKDKILFVDASRGFQQGTTQNQLRGEDIARIVETYRRFADEEKYARVVDREEVGKSDWSLNISRYVDATDVAEKVDVRSALARLRELEVARAAASTTMDDHLTELGYGAE